jgi:hypothetical protein
MQDIFREFIRGTHWPSWLRGFAVAILVVWGIAQRDIIICIIAVALYAVSYRLGQYFPPYPPPPDGGRPHV